MKLEVQPFTHLKGYAWKDKYIAQQRRVFDLPWVKCGMNSLNDGRDAYLHTDTLTEKRNKINVKGMIFHKLNHSFAFE